MSTSQETPEDFEARMDAARAEDARSTLKETVFGLAFYAAIIAFFFFDFAASLSMINIIVFSLDAILAFVAFRMIRMIYRSRRP